MRNSRVPALSVRLTKRLAFVAATSGLLLGLILAGVAGAYYHPANLAARQQTTSLVPAYRQCTSPTNSHGGPLTLGSCAPPALARSDAHIVMGTPTTSKASSSVTLKVVCEPPAPSTENPPCSTTSGDNENLAIKVMMSDIRCKTNSSVTGHCNSANTVGTNDYDGQVVLQAVLRITDTYNGPSGTTTGGTTPATVLDVPFSVGIQCVATSGSSSTGGSCNAATSADVILPGGGGMIKEGKKANVEIGQIQVYDTGPDGQAADCTLPGSCGCPPACHVEITSDALVFVEGLYLP
jgi:hypothetical protein